MIRKPDEVAICFIGGDSWRNQEQIKMLTGLDKYYNIEWSCRSDKIGGDYYSYSQIVNEAVIETTSEFMVFINPKAEISVEDINLIINDLRNGFAYSSIISFGLWGTTKELFRKIGMMDERFIGGGYEDNDFLIRIKQANLAVHWRYRTEKYKHWAFNTADKPILKTQYTGLTDTIYGMKWYKEESTLYRTEIFLQEKKAPKWFLEKENLSISNSWKSWDYTEQEECYFVDNIFAAINNLNISSKIAKATKTRVPATLTVSCVNDIVMFKYTGDEQYSTELVIVLCDQEGKQLRNYVSIKTNHWWGDVLKPSGLFELGEFYDIRVLHGGRVVLHDNYLKAGDLKEYKFGLDVYSFALQEI